jgi:tRNA1Val (adenine37-N6)-methyltransferase
VANQYFRFKQFTVWQQHCAMKVNTLGCILGAYAKHDHPSTILDIGTGTGLIALMLAQQYLSARIQALEIDANAARQASENVLRSPWSDRIVVHPVDAKDYRPADRFDLIVSNPPFFEKHLRTADSRINLARHDSGLTAQQLLEVVVRLLSEGGAFFLVLPPSSMERFSEMARHERLFPFRCLNVQNFHHGSPLAVVHGFSRHNQVAVEDQLTIWDGPGRPSEQFRELLSDYYLDF